MQTIDHETQAAVDAVIRETTTRPPQAELDAIGHQGDVDFATPRPATPEELALCTQQSLVVASGSHGSHVFVGLLAVTPAGVAVQGEAVLYHTDEPRARHGAVSFCGGRVWAFWPHAELIGAEVLKQQD